MTTVQGLINGLFFIMLILLLFIQGYFIHISSMEIGKLKQEKRNLENKIIYIEDHYRKLLRERKTK